MPFSTYIMAGDTTRQNCCQSAPDEAAQCDRLARILETLLDINCETWTFVDQFTSANLIIRAGSGSATMSGIGPSIKWVEVDDFVHPYGDSRESTIAGVWVVDANNKSVSLITKDNFRIAQLPFLRNRLLTLADFEKANPLLLLPSTEQSIPGPYWSPRIDILLRDESFLKPILHDFGYAWRHVLRGRMNNSTFLKLAYATTWLLTMNFSLYELGTPDQAIQGDAHISVTELPLWKAPDQPILQVGSSWFVLAQDLRCGLEMVRAHSSGGSHAEKSGRITSLYVVLSLRRVVLCRVEAKELVWTKPEVLYGEDNASDAAIRMLIWAVSLGSMYFPTALNTLPVEIQDRIIYYGGVSFVASARLGCRLGLGSRFSWIERGSKIGLQEKKRNRTGCSPIESRILFHGVKSGLAYQREREYSSAEPMSMLPPLPRASDTQPAFHCRFFRTENLVF